MMQSIAWSVSAQPYQKKTMTDEKDPPCSLVKMKAGGFVGYMKEDSFSVVDTDRTLTTADTDEENGHSVEIEEKLPAGNSKKPPSGWSAVMSCLLMLLPYVLLFIFLPKNKSTPFGAPDGQGGDPFDATWSSAGVDKVRLNSGDFVDGMELIFRKRLQLHQ